MMTSLALLENLQLSDRAFFTRWRLSFIAICLLACAVYLPALTGLPIWEDNLILGGSAIGGGTSWIRCFTQPFLNSYFRPLVSLSFLLEHRFWGNESMFLFHQTNILMHVLTTAVVIQLLNAAFHNRRIALAGGLFFAVQPVQVSGVAWMGGRADAQGTLFLALFAWGVIRAAQETGKARYGRLAAAALAYTGAILTKEQALFVLPLVPLAFRCFQPEGGTAQRGDAWRATVPFLALAAAFLMAWFRLVPPHSLQGARGFLERFNLAGHTLTYYTLVLLNPTPRWIHTMSLGVLDRSGIWTAIAGYVILGLSIALGLRWLRRCPSAAWFMALILLALLPISNLLPLPSIVVTPYRGGMAGLGVAALLAYAAMNVVPGPGRSRGKLSWRTGLGLGYAALCLGVTAWSAGRWQDEVKIATTCLRYDQDTIFIRYNLSAALLTNGKARPAAAHMEGLLAHLFGSDAWKQPDTAVKALHDNPQILDFVHANLGYIASPDVCVADLYSRLGSARLAMADPVGALNAFTVGAAIAPKHYEANLGLARCAFKSGDLEGAKLRLHTAVESEPNQIEAHALLAEILGQQNQWEGSRDESATCVKINPWLGLAYMDLADAQTHLKDYKAARATLETALNKSVCDPTQVQQKIAHLDKLIQP